MLCFHSASLSEIRKRVNFQRAFIKTLQELIPVLLYKKSEEPNLINSITIHESMPRSLSKALQSLLDLLYKQGMVKKRKKAGRKY
jgi:hypothetical protein